MRAQAIAFFFSLVSSANVILHDVAWAQSGSESNPIGKIVTVAGTVTVEHSAAVIVQAKLTEPSGKVRVGDSVYIGDVVRTGPDGRSAITFADGTAINISSNAHIVLDQFVYDPNGKSNAAVLSLTRGTFTFVAGQIAKTGSMKVETHVATMGIRGTTPHVEISDDGTVSFATLIEEGKEKVLRQRGGAPVMQRRAESPAERYKDLAKHLDIKLKICNGC
jgi:hypothetical protein